MKLTLKRAISTAMIIAMIFSLCLSAFATVDTSQKAKTLRVGYIDYRSFIEKTEDGTYEGYGADYLAEIAKYENFEYEYVYGTWSESMQALENHEIDILCTANFSQERAEKFEFSDFPIGVGQEVLYTRMDNDSLYYDDFTGLQDATIGVLSGSQNIVAFNKYAQRNGFTFKEKGYATDAQMEKALMSGEVDAIVAEHMARHDNLKLIGKYASSPFYIISYKNNNFMEQINFAISQIKAKDANFEAKLYNKYYSDSSVEKSPAFTREEVEYINNIGIINVGILPNRFPLSNFDEKTSEFEGITVEIVREIAKISGLQLNLQPMDLDKKPIDLLKAGKFDAVAGILRTDNFLKDPSLRLSKSILTSDLSVAAIKGSQYDPNRPQTAVIKTSFQAIQEYIKENHPEYSTIYKSTDQECLAAVVDGHADIALQNAYVLNYWLQSPYYSNVAIVPAYFLKEEDCFATLSSADPRLISIVDKSRSVISENTINQFVTANTLGNPYKLTLVDMIYKYKTAITAVILLIIACVTAIATIVTVKLRNLKEMNLKNAELGIAILHAEQASSAKSQFLARMSHEIRTPMNAIVGLTTITKQHINNPTRVLENMEKISSSSKILLNLINDVLDMSAIESDKLKIAYLPFDFKQLMNSITVMYYGQCRQKGIEFISRVNRLTDEVLVGDSLRVQQVLLNILSNAVKFTEPGGTISITATQLPHSDSQTFLHFEVADTGCGMTPKMISRIFSAFEQETSVTAQKYGGSGLGMAITKNLVDLMQGAITVKSEKDKGTIFSVELPFGIPINRKVYSGKNFENIKALIVDDDKETSEYASIVLERIGVAHDCATTGTEALEKIRSSYQSGKGYDLCLIDWRMPEMDGIVLTRKIRAEFSDDAIIIIVSAYDLTEIEAEASEAGANMFVTKPVFQSTIFDMLMSLSGGQYVEDNVSCVKYDFSGYRVLLAEDNALNMEIATELLSMTNIQVECAENGKLALEKFESSADGWYDIILMDVQMPIMDGHESARAIRNSSHPQAKIIPIYAMTANAFTEDISLAISAGMTGHISKPIDTDIMYGVINKELQGKPVKL